jgi:diguanylate cyclase (GGDEF)-like protein/PAS domain S-box-containing protein
MITMPIKDLLHWFNIWAGTFPYPVIMTDFEFKVVHSNDAAKLICRIKEGQANYLENHLRPGLFPFLLDFKDRLQRDFYVQIDLKMEDTGESSLVGHRFNDESKPYYLVMIVPNVYKERLRMANHRFQLLLDHLNEAVLITDAEYRIADINPAFSKMTGYNIEEVIGRMPSLLKSGKQDPLFYKQMHADIMLNGVFIGELVDRKKTGELIHVRSTIYPIKNERESITGYVGILEDISELKFLSSKLAKTSFKDALTGVFNRESFLSILEVKVDMATDENCVALLFIDLNKFKQVNDTYGHQYGDLVLANAASRIKHVLRGNDMVGRYGGDEFVVMLERVTEASAQSVAQKIYEVLALPYEIDEQLIDFTSASIGIALAPKDANKLSALIERADAAMYEAKKALNPLRVFMAKDFVVDSAKDKSIRSELLHAVGTEEFFIRIQPIINMQTQQLVGGEVLARWLNLTFNEVQPNTFFPLANKLGLEKKIDAHILTLTADFLAQYALHEDIFINVNFSADQFNDVHLIDNLRALFQTHPLLQKHLVVEITEHTMIKNIEATSQCLYALHEMGIRIAIDDFGTGFSSLAYLKHFEIDFLKIDISFIQRLEESEKDQEIVKTIITLAKAIGAKTIVEGVERLSQYELLKSLDADYAQGFYFNKALYPNQFYKQAQSNIK